MTKELNIEQNTSTNEYYCVFYVNHKKFYAEISRVFGRCMIFKYDKNDRIDWPDVYHKKADMSKESLIGCINEFMKQACGL